MRRAMRYLRPIAIIGVAAAAAASCGDVIRQGRSPSILVVNSIQAANGDKPTTFFSALNSDVLNLVTTPTPCSDTNPCPTVFNDPGQATLSVAMKDIAVTPTTNNQVTVTRYHVAYTRTDGRNTPGVDVPYPFDGAATVTVAAGGAPISVGFELVRHAAKEESPLVQLITNQNIISVIATVTFYGADLVGNAVSASGQIQITFGNFGG
jgi:hypothetical protein